MAVINFDATQVSPAQMSEQLPVSGSEGYPVIITASEVKANKDNDGGYLALTLCVQDGEHRGSTGVYRLNIFNKNAQASEIAYRQLSAICHAVGVYQVQDSTQLHGIPFRAVVGLQKGKEEAEKGYTEVKGILNLDGSQPGKAPAQPAPAPVAAPQAAPAQSAPQAAPAAAGAPPWAAPQQQPAASSAPPWAAK